MLEAVTRYDIDGVDFDDFFYPYPAAEQDFDDAASFADVRPGLRARPTGAGTTSTRWSAR